MIRAIGCFGANSNPGSLAGLLDAEYNSRTLHYKSMLYMFQGREKRRYRTGPKSFFLSQPLGKNI